MLEDLVLLSTDHGGFQSLRKDGRLSWVLPGATQQLPVSEADLNLPSSVSSRSALHRNSLAQDSPPWCSSRTWSSLGKRDLAVSCSGDTQVLGNAKNKHDAGWHPCGAEADFPFPKTKEQREGRTICLSTGLPRWSEPQQQPGQWGAITDFVILQF